jgi:hypothetical protein
VAGLVVQPLDLAQRQNVMAALDLNEAPRCGAKVSAVRATKSAAMEFLGSESKRGHYDDLAT